MHVCGVGEQGGKILGARRSVVRGQTLVWVKLNGWGICHLCNCNFTQHLPPVSKVSRKSLKELIFSY